MGDEIKPHLTRVLCLTDGIGRRLAYSVAEEPNMAPKFT